LEWQIKEKNICLQYEILNKSIMKTEKKIKYYEFSQDDQSIVEEPFIKYATLNLDESKRYTYADYLTWVDEKQRELINGFIRLMSSPTEIHARITHLMNWILESLVRKRKGKCRVYHAPFDVRLPIEDSNEDEKIFNVVQPDICVICDFSKIDKKGCVGAPDLIVEVLSLSTSKKDWNEKFNLYEKVGVVEYWIIDPKEKVLHQFLLQSNGKYDAGTVYQCNQKAPVHIFEGLEIDLKELFEE
jgi:Uma2 family endonuclease